MPISLLVAASFHSKLAEFALIYKKMTALVVVSKRS